MALSILKGLLEGYVQSLFDEVTENFSSGFWFGSVLSSLPTVLLLYFVGSYVGFLYVEMILGASRGLTPIDILSLVMAWS